MLLIRSVFTAIPSVTINAPPQLNNQMVTLSFEVIEFTITSPSVSIGVAPTPGSIVIINGLKANNASLAIADPSVPSNFTLSSFPSSSLGACDVFYPAYVIVFTYGLLVMVIMLIIISLSLTRPG